MTAQAILQHSAGKSPAEIVSALHAAGFAIVPTEVRSGFEGVTILTSHKPFADRYAAVVDYARAKA